MYLLTGFPHLLTRHLAEAILARTPDIPVALLVQERYAEQARQLYGEHARVFVGDNAAMHLGLSTPEYKELTQTCTDVVHAAGIDDSRDAHGTRAVLDLALDCRHLRRLTHFSTVFVSGDRKGIVAEDELSSGQAFRTPWEHACFEGEILVRRAMGQLPCSVLRPSLLLEEAFEGPFAPAMRVVVSPLEDPLPLPGDGAAPLHVVPVEFVVASAMAIHHDARAVGRTFHLVDPNPPSVRRVYELVAQRAGKALPKAPLAARLGDALRNLPVVDRLAREQRPAAAWLEQLAFYTSRNTQELVPGLHCPPMEHWIDKLIDLARAKVRAS